MKKQRWNPQKKAWLAVSSIILFFALLYFTKRQFLKQVEKHEHPYEYAILSLEKRKNLEWCDSHESAKKIVIAQVLDRFKKRISELRLQANPEEIQVNGTTSLGAIFIIPEQKNISLQNMDRTIWSWSDAYYILQKTQNMENQKLWLDLDSSVRFLLLLDRRRLVDSEPFLSPEKTMHQFFPHGAVKRTRKNEFTIFLNPGDFTAEKKQLAKMIESIWTSPQYHLKVKWVSDPHSYRFVAGLNETKSYTLHSQKIISLKKIIHYRTIAHEVGHVMGFDDHYYEVWHKDFCYYTQEYQTNDLMSDTQFGQALAKHWEILNQAYPWKSEPVSKPFSYNFSSELLQKKAG